MNEFGKQCVRLRRQDHSLLEIVRITGKGKSSVYPYIKNIPLSEKRMLQRITQISCTCIELRLHEKGRV